MLSLINWALVVHQPESRLNVFPRITRRGLNLLSYTKTFQPGFGCGPQFEGQVYVSILTRVCSELPHADISSHLNPSPALPAGLSALCPGSYSSARRNSEGGRGGGGRGRRKK